MTIESKSRQELLAELADVRQRLVEAEETLHESKRVAEALRSLAKFPDENPFPVLRLNQDGCVLYGNKASDGLLQSWGVTVGGCAPAAWRNLAAETLANEVRQNVEVELGAQTFLFNITPIAGEAYVNLYANDITQRKRAEQVLRKSEEHTRQRAEELETLMDLIPTAVWVSHDTQCNVITGNRAANHFYEAESGDNVSAGPQPGKQDLTRRFFQDGRELGPDELPMQVAAAQGVEVRNSELDVLLPSGKTLSMLGNASPLRDTDGRVRGSIAAYVDITERKRADLIRRSEERFRGAFEQAAVGMAHVAPDGRLLRANQRLCDTLGYSQKELRQLRFQDLTCPENLTLSQEYIHKLLAGRIATFSLDKRYVQKDGALVWVNETASLMRAPGGAPDYLAVVVVDISRRKQAETALMAAYTRLERISSSNVIGMTVADASGRILESNDYYLNLLGYTRQEFAAGLVRWDRQTPSEYLPADRRAIEELRTTGTCASYEKEYVRRDGSRIWVLLACAMLPGPGEQLLAIVVDITARKLVEAQLRNTVQDLRRSNAELEQFAYVASDDLQEPLRMVASYTQLLARRYQGQLDSNADEFITYVVNGVTRMQHLIDDLLAYSRVGSQGTPFQPVHTTASLAQALLIEGAVIHEAGAVITYDELPVVQADEGQLVQLFQNLVGNAVKFHGCESPKVHVSAQNMDGEWVFAVRDNGIGIAPEYFQRIFVIFQRLHGPMEYPGTGIGLAICKKIVEQHGGRIWVESQPGQGATFYFTLPDRQGSGIPGAST